AHTRRSSRGNGAHLYKVHALRGRGLQIAPALSPPRELAAVCRSLVTLQRIRRAAMVPPTSASNSHRLPVLVGDSEASSRPSAHTKTQSPEIAQTGIRWLAPAVHERP